jgi:hypothetical protein
MRRTLHVLLLATAPALLFPAPRATAMQSTIQAAPNQPQPQANNQASSHDRHHHRNSAGKRHHHHHRADKKH